MKLARIVVYFGLLLFLFKTVETFLNTEISEQTIGSFFLFFSPSIAGFISADHCLQYLFSAPLFFFISLLVVMIEMCYLSEHWLDFVALRPDLPYHGNRWEWEALCKSVLLMQVHFSRMTAWNQVKFSFGMLPQTMGDSGRDLVRFALPAPFQIALVCTGFQILDMHPPHGCLRSPVLAPFQGIFRKC